MIASQKVIFFDMLGPVYQTNTRKGGPLIRWCLMNPIYRSNTRHISQTEVL